VDERLEAGETQPDDLHRDFSTSLAVA
jgi:hypothetical protein